jgi:membrane-associated PAP2 superfamily phosphatase
MSLGWVMGLYQMVIAEHFLGYTVVTMLLSWFIALVIAKAVTTYSKKRKLSKASVQV